MHTAQIKMFKRNLLFRKYSGVRQRLPRSSLENWKKYIYMDTLVIIITITTLRVLYNSYYLQKCQTRYHARHSSMFSTVAPNAYLTWGWYCISSRLWAAGHDLPLVHSSKNSPPGPGKITREQRFGKYGCCEGFRRSQPWFTFKGKKNNNTRKKIEKL